MGRKPKARETKSFVATMSILPRKQKPETRTCSLYSQWYSKMTNPYFLIYPYSLMIASLFLSSQAWEVQCPHSAWVSLCCLVPHLGLEQGSTPFSTARACSVLWGNTNKTKDHVLHLPDTNVTWAVCCPEGWKWEVFAMTSGRSNTVTLRFGYICTNSWARAPVQPVGSLKKSNQVFSPSICRHF